MLPVRPIVWASLTGWAFSFLDGCGTVLNPTKHFTILKPLNWSIDFLYHIHFMEEHIFFTLISLNVWPASLYLTGPKYMLPVPQTQNFYSQRKMRTKFVIRAKPNGTHFWNVNCLAFLRDLRLIDCLIDWVYSALLSEIVTKNRRTPFGEIKNNMKKQNES